MNGIIWLASYPKSGNTWLRAFISHLLEGKDEKVDINQMKTDGIFSARSTLDEITGIETSNLTPEEIDTLRPAVYNYIATVAKRRLFIKVHDAYTYLADGSPLLGTVNAKAVYILRNPLDVAVSLANHLSKSLDETIRHMNDETFAFCRSKDSLPNQTRQKLLTWSAHVQSWAGVSAFPVYFLRYEDMKADPIAAFTGAVRFIGMDCTDAQIQRAIELSDFKKMKAEEEKNGFGEKPAGLSSFFRAGKTGDWRNHLSDAQRDKLIADHRAVMRQYGYLNSADEPVYL